MSDVTRRIARWQAKCTPERTKATLDSIREDMRARYEAATVALSAMETEVKQTLNAQIRRVRCRPACARQPPGSLRAAALRLSETHSSLDHWTT